MTTDQIMERALRKAGIFPPSAMDPHYGDKQELTKPEIILRSLDDMGLLSPSAQDPEFAGNIRRIRIAVATLQLRLPDADITVCGAFTALGVGCCAICHSDAVEKMRLVELPCSGWAWLCCAVDAASSPEPCLIIHEPEEEPPAGKRPTGRPRNGGRRED